MVNRTHLTARSLIVAFLTLLLAAGVAAAARPDGGHARDLDDAAEVSGDTVEDQAEETAEETTEDADAAKGADLAAEEHPENHGKYVSEAARGETPEGDWANHGEYVRSIAQGDEGKPGSEEAAAAEGADTTDPDVTARKDTLVHGHGHGQNR